MNAVGEGGDPIRPDRCSDFRGEEMMKRSVPMGGGSLLVFAALLSACATTAGPAPRAAPPAEYAALPDTTVCVVDRAAADGLRQIPGKLRGEEVVLLQNGTVQALEVVHPVNVIAGYAGRE